MSTRSQQVGRRRLVESARKKAGLSYAQLAKQLDTTPPHAWRLCKDMNTQITEEWLHRFAEVFGWTIEHNVVIDGDRRVAV